MKSLEFANLPLVEVAIRLAIEQPLPVSLGKVADLYAQLKERYNSVDDLVTNEPPPGAATVLVEYQLGRTRAAAFAGHGRGLVAALQPNLLSLKWLHDPGAKGTYPRFVVLEEELAWYLGQVREVFGADSAKVTVANIAYINFVLTPPDVRAGKFLIPSAWPSFLDESELFHGMNLSWRRDDVDLRLVVERGEATLSDKAEQGYRLMTVAGKRMDAAQDTPGTLRTLHARLQALFASLISEFAKKQWGFVDAAS